MSAISVRRPFLSWPILLLPALSLSIGWGIRGNFGHEHGAMIPGALAAMAVVLAIDRPDWHRRVAFFGMFGAIGWSFGGSMSYGHVIAYTHSGDPPNILYGFAALWLIGFLWGALGGAGTALPAYLSRERLTEFLPPLLWFFAVLAIHDLTYDGLNAWLAARGLGVSYGDPAMRHEEALYWFDTDWTTALIAVVVPLVYRLVRRRSDEATGLMLHLAIGWWIGFLLFPVLLDWRMTPPRGDNWAGCLGMAVGAAVFFQRRGLPGITHAMLVSGFVGGIGFALATAIKLLWIRTGWTANWHSVMEQTYGLINGLGIGLAMAFAARHAPEVTDQPPLRRWADWFAPAFVALFVTYINARKNPEEWIKAEAIAPALYWFSTITWFNIGSAAIAATFLWIMVRHLKRPVPLIPSSWAGKGQALFLGTLAASVAMNFERAIVAFAEQRLITEGVILINACWTTVLVVLWTGAHAVDPPAVAEPNWKPPLGRRCLLGGVAGVLCCLFALATTLLAFGARPAEGGTPRYRFGGPTSQASTPAPGQAHP